MNVSPFEFPFIFQPILSSMSLVDSRLAGLVQAVIATASITTAAISHESRIAKIIMVKASKQNHGTYKSKKTR